MSEPRPGHEKVDSTRPYRPASEARITKNSRLTDIRRGRSSTEPGGQNPPADKPLWVRRRQ